MHLLNEAMECITKAKPQSENSYVNQYIKAENLIGQCQPCDLVEFYRGKYCHWALCSINPEYVYSADAEDKTKTRAKITLKRIVDIANSGDIPEHRVVRINNKETSALSKGYTPKLNKDIIEELEKVENTYVPYNFLSTNCEYYCCVWKFGHGWTDQVENPFKTLLSTSPMINVVAYDHTVDDVDENNIIDTIEFEIL